VEGYVSRTLSEDAFSNVLAGISEQIAFFLKLRIRNFIFSPRFSRDIQLLFARFSRGFFAKDSNLHRQRVTSAVLNNHNPIKEFGSAADLWKVAN
jgi:hypothetical protein